MITADASASTRKKARGYRAESWWHRERDKRLLSMHESGKSTEEISAAMQLSVKYVCVILKFYRNKEKRQ